LGTKNIEAREPISMADVKPYWKSLWEEGAQLSESRMNKKRREQENE
jgi:hypothetical protein